MPYGSSRAQGIVRDNRFYHADMGITMAFPRGWTIENQRDRILAYTEEQGRAACRCTHRAAAREAVAARVPAREAEGRFAGQGEELSSQRHGGLRRCHAQRFAARRRRRPGALGRALSRQERVPVRAARAAPARNGVPADDGLFMSSLQTLRDLKPSEYPLAQPYRIKIVRPPTHQARGLRKNVPVEKYQEGRAAAAQRRCTRTRQVSPGQYIKVVESSTVSPARFAPHLLSVGGPA